MKQEEREFFLNQGFTEEQITEISEGKAAGLNVAIYANKNFLPIQMRQIRLGLAEKLPVEIYAKLDYDWFQMEEIRLGLKSGVDISLYAEPEMPYETMRQIRKGLEIGLDLRSYLGLEANIIREIRRAHIAGVDVLKYVEQGYDAEQIREIRHALEIGIDMDRYLSKEYRAASIAEIRTGLENGVDVSRYASMDYGWRQMREIRKGLELQVDVDKFISNFYTWDQMREIRYGLKYGLDVSEYSSLRYTAEEMHAKRLAILDDIYKEQERILQSQIKSEDFIFEFGPNDMEAYITVLPHGKEVTRERLLEILEQNHIRKGILENAIDKIVSGLCSRGAILIAQGQIPYKGKDGFYEFFFRTDLERKPKILPDGTVDYRHMNWFEMVKVGQKLAYYHEAEEGTDGFSVTGNIIKARKGQEQRVLRGSGFKLEDDKRTYVAALDGMIQMENNEIKITQHLLLEEVNLATGDVQFNGSLEIKGDVGGGAIIRATGDIVIEGTVEGATIESGGSIALKKGMNAAGHGQIIAGKDVVSRFFENVKVVAKGNIEVDKCLNSQLYAGGMVISTNTIAGGITSAGSGFNLKHVGNQAGLHTALKIKVDEKVWEEYKMVKSAIFEVGEELLLLNKSYAEFQEKFPPEVRNEMEMFGKVEKAVFTKKKQLEQFRVLESELEEKIKKVRSAKMLIAGQAHEGVVLETDDGRWYAADEFNILLRIQNNQIEAIPN